MIAMSIVSIAYIIAGYILFSLLPWRESSASQDAD